MGGTRPLGLAGTAGVSGAPRGGAGDGAGAGGSGGAGATGGKVEPPLDLDLDTPPPTGTFTDARDGTTYAWVEIDGTRWMAENLRYELPEEDIMTCRYDAVAMRRLCEEYGYFYGWSAAHAQALITGYVDNELPAGSYGGLCPAGWHLPSRDEWVGLLNHVVELAGLQPPTDILGMLTYRGIAEPFRAETEWTAGRGTNELRFDLKPYTETFIGGRASFWVGGEYSKASGETVSFGPKDVHLGIDFKVYRHSIRCVQGEPDTEFPELTLPAPVNTSGVLTDARDGKTYATVRIGEQNWMAENLAFEPATGSLCYANQSEHCRLFGRLYGFDTAQAVCPSGFHLPTVPEWHQLAEYVDEQTDALGRMGEGDIGTWKIGKHLVSSLIWSPAPEEEATYGFNVLPGSWMLKSENSGAFPTDSHFWSASSGAEVVVLITPTTFQTMPVIEGVQSSVRCLENAAP